MTALGLLTLKQAADELGYSVKTLRRRIIAGAIPAFVDGRMVRVRQADLRRYVAERTGTRVPPAQRPRATAGSRPAGRGERLWD